MLQVDSEAEDEVIQAAYRRLARKYHPDLAETPEAAARMAAINAAWELIGDPAARAAFDRERAAAAEAGPGPSPEPATGASGSTPRSSAAPDRSGPQRSPTAARTPRAGDRVAGLDAGSVEPWRRLRRIRCAGTGSRRRRAATGSAVGHGAELRPVRRLVARRGRVATTSSTSSGSTVRRSGATTARRSTRSCAPRADGSRRSVRPPIVTGCTAADRRDRGAGRPARRPSLG